VRRDLVGTYHNEQVSCRGARLLLGQLVAAVPQPKSDEQLVIRDLVLRCILANNWGGLGSG
jgi:hypothetical protein